MKSDNLYGIAEIIRSLTPYGFCVSGLVIILLGVANSKELVGDRFVYIVGSATGLFGAASGGFSPNRGQSQARINHAYQVDIDQSK